MSDASASLSTLSQGALVLLDYLRRYRAQKGAGPPKEFLARTLKGAYPLFRYLFPGSQFIDALVDELEHAGGFEGEFFPDARLNERLRKAAEDYIRLQCKDILGHIPLCNVWEVVESAPLDKNVNLFIERLQFLRQCNLYDAVGLSKQYSKALLEVGAGSVSEKRKLIDSFAQLVGMEPIEYGGAAADLPSGLFKAAALVPNGDFRAAVALLNGEGDADQQLGAATSFAEAFRSENIVFLLLGDNSLLTPKMEAFAAQNRAVLLKDSDLKRIGLSAKPRESMRECISPQLRPSTISPFRYHGPVKDDGFFGRKDELRKIRGTANVALLGPRRIGKTSLLIALRNEVNTTRGQDGAIAVFVDLGSDRRLSWFQNNLMQATIQEASHANLEMEWIESGEPYFEELAMVLRKSPRKFLFLLDEVDHLVMDAQVGLFEEFVRSISNTGRARFVLSGYMNLRKRTEDRDSFLYNLLTPMILGPLSRPEAAELVRTQMERIYVGFESDQVVDDMLDYGTTFAAHVQCMCELLLQRLDRPGHKRSITSADVLEVYRSEQFSRELTAEVVESTEQGLGPLERLVLYWAASRDDEHFTVKDLLEDLCGRIQSIKFSELSGALNYLALTYLLTEHRGKYRFYTSHLGEKLREMGDTSSIINQLVREFRDKQGRG